ncbi:hypothetical protein AB0C74_36955 [Spirillospora sp. NPDC048832]
MRMFKPESIDDVIARIAEDDLGLDVDVDGKRFLVASCRACLPALVELNELGDVTGVTAWPGRYPRGF